MNGGRAQVKGDKSSRVDGRLHAAWCSPLGSEKSESLETHLKNSRRRASDALWNAGPIPPLMLNP